MVGLTTYFRCLPRGTDCPGSASRDEAFCRGLRDAKGKQPQCGSRWDIAGHGGADGGRGRYRVRPRFLPSR